MFVCRGLFDVKSLIHVGKLPLTLYIFLLSEVDSAGLFGLGGGMRSTECISVLSLQCIFAQNDSPECGLPFLSRANHLVKKCVYSPYGQEE